MCLYLNLGGTVDYWFALGIMHKADFFYILFWYYSGGVEMDKYDFEKAEKEMQELWDEYDVYHFEIDNPGINERAKRIYQKSFVRLKGKRRNVMLFSEKGMLLKFEPIRFLIMHLMDFEHDEEVGLMPVNKWIVVSC